MELRVKFADGTVIPYLNAKEQPEFYDNANRRVLEINFAKDTVSLDALDHLVSNIENVKKIVLINELEKMENIFDYYQIKMQVSCAPVVVSRDESTCIEKKEEQITLKLGRLTPIEQQLAALGVQM